MLIRFAFLLVVVSSSPLLAQSARVTLSPGTSKHKISRHIYGHFSEHLGRCVYGGIFVGEDERQIAHAKGIRTDVVAALKKLQIPNLRWPGGCFADTYHWKDGIGPKEKRPKIVNSWWGGVTEDNSFGTHEFMELCRQLEAEPFISANVGSGTVQELADWLHYTNSSNESPMTRLRQANGRSEPWSVRFWGVGNEPWGCGGNMRPEYYADLYRRYATYMKVYPRSGPLYRVAAGASSDDYEWTRVLMKNIPHKLMEAVSLHHYSVFDWDNRGPSVNYSDTQYFQTIQAALKMEALLRGHIAVMDEFDPEGKIDLVVDEWGGWYDAEPEIRNGILFQQSTMRDAMIAATTLNSFNNHCERVKIANLAQMVNVLQAVVLTDEDKILLTPTYHVFEMFTVHHDMSMIPATLDGPQLERNGSKLEAISVSASKTESGIVHVSLANIDPKLPCSVSIEGLAAKSIGGRVLKANSIRDHNTFEKPNAIQPHPFEDAKIDDGRIIAKLPPASVVVIQVTQQR